MQVLVRDNDVDQVLRVLKKKLQREGVFREMKLRSHYEKPSSARQHPKNLPNVRIACTPESNGPGIGGIPGRSFRPPDRGGLRLISVAQASMIWSTRRAGPIAQAREPSWRDTVHPRNQCATLRAPSAGAARVRLRSSSRPSTERRAIAGAHRQSFAEG